MVRANEGGASPCVTGPEGCVRHKHDCGPERLQRSQSPWRRRDYLSDKSLSQGNLSPNLIVTSETTCIIFFITTEALIIDKNDSIS